MLNEQDRIEINEELAQGKSITQIAEDRGENPDTFYSRIRYSGLKIKKQLIWTGLTEGKGGGRSGAGRRREAENASAAAQG